MNKRQALEQFNVNHCGIIQNPGRYEGEMIYVPHFWEQNDEDRRVGDPDYIEWRVFEVTEDDKAEFPELAKDRVTHIAIHENDDGSLEMELLGQYYTLEEFKQDVADEIWGMKQDA